VSKDVEVGAEKSHEDKYLFPGDINNPDGVTVSVFHQNTTMGGGIG
jgi:hypothetical protein